jgi:hypothetical protein
MMKQHGNASVSPMSDGAIQTKLAHADYAQKCQEKDADTDTDKDTDTDTDTAAQTLHTQQHRQAAGVTVRQARRESSHLVPS